MITVTRIKTILNLALPITVGLFSEYVMALIDVAMVGKLGDKAVSAIGLSSFSHTMFMAFVTGLAPAIQGIVARRVGEQSSEKKCLPINAGVILVLLIGIPLSVFCYYFTPFLFNLVSSDVEVTQEGIPYLRALFIATIAFGFCNAFEGFWTGIARVKIYMSIILFTICLNILLNYMLIFGNFGAPRLETLGAGIATAISMGVATIIYFVVTYIYFRHEGFLSVRPSFSLFTRILKIGFPVTLHDIFFSGGFLVFFWMIGQLGVAELSIATVITRITIVMFLFAHALGLSSGTLVSNAIGSGNVPLAAQLGWDAGKIGVFWLSLLGLPILIFPQEFLWLFLTDPETIALGVMPLQLTALTTGLVSLVYIFSLTLITIGDGNRVMIVSFIFQWLLFLPAVWVVGPYLNLGLREVWFVQTAYGLMLAAVITAIWTSGRWKAVAI